MHSKPKLHWCRSWVRKCQRGWISLGLWRKRRMLLMTVKCGIEHNDVCFILRFSLFFFFHIQVVRKMMWLMDHVFKYTNFGLVSLIHGDFFIRQVGNPDWPPNILISLPLSHMMHVWYVMCVIKSSVVKEYDVLLYINTSQQVTCPAVLFFCCFFSKLSQISS